MSRIGSAVCEPKSEQSSKESIDQSLISYVVCGIGAFEFLIIVYPFSFGALTMSMRVPFFKSLNSSLPLIPVPTLKSTLKEGQSVPDPN